MLKFYKSMTLLNTMDRILYESQRQVCGDGLQKGAWNHLRSPYLCLSQKTAPKELFCLGILRVLGGLEGEYGMCPAQGKKDGPDH